MAKMELKLNKKLLLKHVIVYEIRDISIEALDKQIQKFLANLKTLNVEVFGPLITKNYGVKIQQDGSVTLDYDVMIQARNYEKYGNIYDIYESIAVEDCVYVRFEDHPRFLNFAYSKLDIFFYEQNIETDGVIYNVLVTDTPEFIVMDIFRPR